MYTRHVISHKETQLEKCVRKLFLPDKKIQEEFKY